MIISPFIVFLKNYFHSRLCAYTYYQFRGVFGALSNINYRGFFAKINISLKIFHHRCSTGFEIRFCNVYKSDWIAHLCAAANAALLRYSLNYSGGSELLITFTKVKQGRTGWYSMQVFYGFLKKLRKYLYEMSIIHDVKWV